MSFNTEVTPHHRRIPLLALLLLIDLITNFQIQRQVWFVHSSITSQVLRMTTSKKDGLLLFNIAALLILVFTYQPFAPWAAVLYQCPAG